MTVGERIKKIRLEKGLTQKQLSEKCGIDSANLRKYESGQQNPKTETLNRIADALEVDILTLTDISIPPHLIHAFCEKMKNIIESDCVNEVDNQLNNLEILNKFTSKTTDFSKYQARIISELKEKPVFTKCDEKTLNTYNKLFEAYIKSYMAGVLYDIHRMELLLILIKNYASLNLSGMIKANEYITDLSEQEKYTKPDNED